MQCGLHPPPYELQLFHYSLWGLLKGLPSLDLCNDDLMSSKENPFRLRGPPLSAVRIF